jgi:pyrophosphate--fructose-6-phosphate 1-phosphotransferase
MNPNSLHSAELNDLLAGGVDNRDHAAVAAGLSPHSREVFESLPLNFKYELLLERDPHGNVQVG